MVMPLRITHVDTKVLVFLVQAMPTSLHAAPRDPVGKSSAQGDRRPQESRRKKKKKNWNNEVISSDCAAAQYPRRGASTSKEAFLIEKKKKETRAGVKYLQVKVPPRSIHRTSRTAPLASVRTGETGERRTERPAAANGKDGER